MLTFAGANRKEQRRNGEKQSTRGSPEHFRRLRHLGTDGTTGQGCYDTRTGWHHDGVVSCDGPLRDRLTFAGAAVFGLVCNQCCFTIGLSITSPVNASIVTTSMPIFAMILSFLILREPITWKKAGGVAVGCAGALTLVLTSVNAADSKVGDVRGDVLVMCAQLSYALFLSLFNRFIKKYDIVTVNRWMFLWATILVWPFTVSHVAQTDWQAVPLKSWLEAGYVVVFGTYVGYLLIVTAQKVLRPTVVSIYNYVQPAVAVAVTVLTGMGVFKPTQGLAVLLVFVGVWLVTKSKSRRDMEKRDNKPVAEG